MLEAYKRVYAGFQLEFEIKKAPQREAFHIKY